jgi:hypothetical protein
MPIVKLLFDKIKIKLSTISTQKKKKNMYI